MNLRTERSEGDYHNKRTQRVEVREDWKRFLKDSQTLQQKLTYLVGCSLVLGHTFCILATLCGRQFCYPNLPIPGTHSQGGITTVRKELGLGC
jgi:hypothetical protein